MDGRPFVDDEGIGGKVAVMQYQNLVCVTSTVMEEKLTGGSWGLMLVRSTCLVDGLGEGKVPQQVEEKR